MPEYLDDDNRWGYVSWQPSSKTRDLLRHVNEILDLYKLQRPLTLRQIFYRLVAAYHYPHTAGFYGNTLSRTLTLARRAEFETNDGELLFDVIRDDEFIKRIPGCYADLADFWEETKEQAKDFTLDRQVGQSRHVVVWVEGAGMVPQLQQVALPYGIPVFSSGKFDGIQAKRDLGVEWSEIVAGFQKNEETGELVTIAKQPIRVLHLGDHNPSGIHIFEALARDVIRFAEQTAERQGWAVREIEFRRIGLLPGHVTDIAPDVPNAKDNRRFHWMAIRLGTGGLEERININPRQAWELEALAPNQIAAILEAAILQDWDRQVFRGVIEKETKGQSVLAQQLDIGSRTMVRPRRT